MIGHLPNDWWHVAYHARLRNATFCGAFPGDGWSGGISSAIFAGCVPVMRRPHPHLPNASGVAETSSATFAGCVPLIVIDGIEQPSGPVLVLALTPTLTPSPTLPQVIVIDGIELTLTLTLTLTQVIVMDGIEQPFENVLNYAAFSVRIAEAGVERLPPPPATSAHLPPTSRTFSRLPSGAHRRGGRRAAAVHPSRARPAQSGRAAGGRRARALTILVQLVGAQRDAYLAGTARRSAAVLAKARAPRGGARGCARHDYAGSALSGGASRLARSSKSSGAAT